MTRHLSFAEHPVLQAGINCFREIRGLYAVASVPGNLSKQRPQHHRERSLVRFALFCKEEVAVHNSLPLTSVIHQQQRPNDESDGDFHHPEINDSGDRDDDHSSQLLADCSCCAAVQDDRSEVEWRYEIDDRLSAEDGEYEGSNSHRSNEQNAVPEGCLGFISAVFPKNAHGIQFEFVPNGGFQISEAL